MDKTSLWIKLRLLILFIGYGVVGCLLGLSKVTLLVWIITLLAILYLAWSGTGAIALTLLGITFLLGVGIYQRIWLETFSLLGKLPLTRSFARYLSSLHTEFFVPSLTMIGWTGALFFLWLLAIALVFHHGRTQLVLSQQMEQLQVFISLSLLGVVGLSLGYFITP